MLSHNRRRHSILIQLFDLWLIQLSNWRWSWRGTIVVDTITPLVGIVAMGVFARDLGREALAYVLTGNMVLGLMFGNLDKVASNFAFMRATGSLGYFATLPVHRTVFVLATLLAFMVLSVPALAVTTIVGSALLNIPLAPSPLLLIVVPLCAIPLAGLGALIGSSVRTPQESGSWSLLMTLILAGMGPVVVPPNRLPGFMLMLGRLSPATYAASALRQTLLGPITSRLWLDLVVLAGLAAVIFALVRIRMTWRQSE